MATAPCERDVHVAMAIQAFAPIVGGGEVQLERLLSPLASRGVYARVLTRAVRGASHHDVVRGAGVLRSPLAGESPAAAIAYVARALLDLVLHRRTTDVVHAHGALSPATIALGATFLGIPAVVTPLGAGAPGDLRRLQRKPGGPQRLRLLVRRAHFVALSDDLASELRDLGVAPARIHEIPNGFDAAMFHPVEPAERARLRHELHLPPARTSFLFVGRLHPVKRVDTVIDALGLVPDGALVIVGDGTERAALERRAAVGGVSDRVMFVGSSDRVHEYMQAADALVLPSVAEGMSNALIEALACALPCAVTSAISGVDELVAPDRGVLVRPGDVAAWAAVMRELAGEPSRRRSLGEAAARYVHARFTLDRTADRLATLYRELARA